MMIDELSREDLLAENAKRVATLKRKLTYDPIGGMGCVGPRFPVRHPVSGMIVMVPKSMREDEEYSKDMDEASWVKLRHRHDFEFWAATCVRVRHKIKGCMVPLVLNAPQRHLLAQLEQQRTAGEPGENNTAKSETMGRKHFGTDVYGVDSVLPQTSMALTDMCQCE